MDKREPGDRTRIERTGLCLTLRYFAQVLAPPATASAHAAIRDNDTRSPIATRFHQALRLKRCSGCYI